MAKLVTFLRSARALGAQAQALVKLVENLTEYTIVDIPEVLALSRNYLAKVLSKEEYAKINFIDAFSLRQEEYEGNPVDLVINIDSFQEMPKETIRYYFERFIKDARFFYSKNAIGKYILESVGLYDVDEKQLLDVFSLGLSTDVIDIFNEDEIEKAREKHVVDYLPSQSFSVIAQEPLGIFPYYHNVLYGQGSMDGCR